MKKIYLLSFALLFLTDITILNNFQFLNIGAIIAFITLLFVPGLLILKLLGVNPVSKWEQSALAVGSSVAFLILLGLMLNTLALLIGFKNPLSLIPFLSAFNISIILLLVLNFIISKTKYRNTTEQVVYEKKIVQPSKINILSSFVFTVLSLSFIPLSVLGAFSLNNNASNFFTVVLLALIALTALSLTLLRNHINQGVFPTFLYLSGLAMLFSTSLRSWAISGHDIQWEWFVFQLTKSQYLWDINLYRDAYNACLSITILPTILSNFINFPDMYLYKIVYQLIFAFTPVTVYLFLKKYTDSFWAFISAFIYISFPTFILDMPMLNRQELGFLFFSLFIYMLYSDRMTPINSEVKQKKTLGMNLLMYLFAIGIVLSHYATTYITVGLITGVFVLSISSRLVLNNKRIKAFLQARYLLKKINLFTNQRYIYLPTVIILFSLTLLWNSVITKTSDGLSTTFIQTISNIHRIFDDENKSADTSYSLFFAKKINNEEFVTEYIQEAQAEAKRLYPNELLSLNQFNNYIPRIIRPERLPVTEFGRILQNMGINDIFLFNFYLRQFFAKFIQVAIIIGILGLLFYRSKNTYNAEYILACIVGVFLILLMVILPQISLNYGLLRLFQQLLIFLALPLTMGSMLILHRITKKLTLYFVSVLVIIFFLTLSGFISESTGGYYPQYHLNNGGLYYEAYYIHETEISSINWLKNNMLRNTTVQADMLSGDKLFGSGSIYTLDGVIPQVIQQFAYVYAGKTNNYNKSIISVDRNLMIEYPNDVLKANKNVIYNNGLSSIYR